MRTSLTALFLALLSAVQAGEISWNVRLTQTSADGIIVPRVAFSDGAKNYALSIDGETSAEVAGAGSRFIYKRVPSAAFDIQPSPITPVLPFNAETLERYRSAARMRAPAGLAVTNVEETVAPLNINGWQSFRLSYTFSQHGKKVRKSVTFLTLANGQQAILETSAYETEFKAAMERSEYLIRSWHELDAKAAPPTS